MSEDEDDLQTALANTPWSVLLIPFALAVAVLVAVVVIAVMGI